MEIIPCNTCGSSEFKPLFSKSNHKNELFHIVQCIRCSLVQVSPQPSPKEVASYYSEEYFLKRSDRGYDNYFSEGVRNEISRVFGLNLKDLDFQTWEKSLSTTKRCLDVGCAAGYFVDYMQSRGWDSYGMDIAQAPVKFARDKLKLKVEQVDFLEWKPTNVDQFDLITLWASIEHLHKPKETLEKIYTHLKPGGRVILSTCRWGNFSETTRTVLEVFKRSRTFILLFSSWNRKTLPFYWFSKEKTHHLWKWTYCQKELFFTL